MFYYKYKKYKNKYIGNAGSASKSLKEKIIENYEITKSLVKSNNLSLTDNNYISFLNFLKINPISDNILVDLKDFINGCRRLADWLNIRVEKTPESRLPIPVICPGDSPSKIIKFLQRSDLIDNSNFNFISFSLSDMVNYYEYYSIRQDSGLDFIQKYISDQIKDYPNLENLVIIDYIARGCSIYSIIDSIKYLIKTKKIPDSKIPIFDKIIKHIYIETKSLVSYRYSNMWGEKKGPIPTTNYVINISNYFDGDIKYIMDAEKYNNRCLPSNVKYKTNLTYDEDKIFNCNLFVYTALLYYQNSGQFIQKWESIPSTYNSKNIIPYLNKILTVTIINDNKEIEKWTDVFLSSIGYGGTNTIKLEICPKDYSQKSKILSFNLNKILDVKITRDLGEFQFKNFDAIYGIKYYDENNITRTEDVFYSNASHYGEKLEFIKMSFLSSDYPVRKYNDTDNIIKIYPNQLITAVIDNNLPSKDFELPEKSILRVLMIDGREFYGYLKSNMGWAIYLSIGPENKQLLLINNLIRDVYLISNSDILNCRFRGENYRLLCGNKKCKIVFTNGKNYEINAYFKMNIRDTIIFKFRNDGSDDGITLNECQIIDIIPYEDEDK